MREQHLDFTGSNTLPVPFHAPRSVGSAIFAYDKNGNMLTGLGGKIMTYDRENRPLSVTFNGKRTCYVYGADGARLKKVENLATTQSCAALPATAPVTLYFGPVEIRNFKNATTEQIITYPHPSVRRVYTGAQAATCIWITSVQCAPSPTWLARRSSVQPIGPSAA